MRCSHQIKNSSLLFIIILSFTILSCNKDNNPVEAGNNLDGIWTGTVLSNLVTTPTGITISITQTNNTISGTYSVLTGAYGRITGTISNN